MAESAVIPFNHPVHRLGPPPGTFRISPRRFCGGALATRVARGGPSLTKDGSTSEGWGALPSILCEQPSLEQTPVVLHRFGGGAVHPFSVARGASAAPRAAALVKRLGRPLQSHGETRRLIGTVAAVSRRVCGGGGRGDREPTYAGNLVLTGTAVPVFKEFQ